MMIVNSFQSEWLKRRHSAASWLTLIGALFIPAIVLTKRISDYGTLSQSNSSGKIWNQVYGQCWQYMSVFLLPMGIILTASLLAQIEFGNNAWKQVHTTPQSHTTLFLAKFAVAITMLFQFFLIFNAGIILTGILPALLFRDVPFPQQDFPFLGFLTGNAKFFLYALPILSLQYLLSIHIRNFMVPIGIGFALVVASLIAVSWKYGYFLPYTYCSKQFLINDNRIDPDVNIYYWSAGYFILFTALNYFLFINKKSRG
ncbi:ABC transporter permease [Dyadobacter sp. CY323]|uniref:ABC transporter permease n=1 Tax=Dyadobacter sp. CY323 TaxID=2907302 RepID=UPI001F2FDCE4|nr:ABC transporter permease [Dyadobacter sp. CY323]MCE6991897.1 ABC transporter permease [Dyadobacter sp. CY323]